MEQSSCQIETYLDEQQPYSFLLHFLLTFKNFTTYTGKELKKKTTDTVGDDNMIVTDRLTDTEPTLSDSPAAAASVSGLLNSVLHRCWLGWASGQG